MDATGQAGEPARAENGPRRLYRARSPRLIGGVAAGLGRHFGIDPIIFRIGFVALAFFGGAGLYLYLVMWLIVPVERRPQEGAPSPGAWRRRLAVAVGVTLLAAGAIVLVERLVHGLFGRNWPAAAAVGTPLLVALAAGGAWLWLRQRGNERRLGPDALVLKRIMWGVALIAALLTVGLLSALAAGTGGGVAVAAIGIGLGLALAASAFLRGARWLIAPTLTIILSAGVVFAAHADLRGGFGERQYRPLSVAQLQSTYRLGAGRLELDLRDIRFPAGNGTLRLKLGAGELAVVVPRDVCVATEARIGGGYVRALEREGGGMDLTWRSEPGAPAGVPRLLIQAEIGLGTLLVSHRPLEGGEGFGQGESFGRESYGTNSACFEAAGSGATRAPGT